MSLTVASLHIHPIKSLGGFSVPEARITDRGFAHDRRWMLVDGSGRFISQRENARMACLHCAPWAGGFRVTDIRNSGSIDLPWTITTGTATQTTIWNDPVITLDAPPEVSAWFTRGLEMDVRLVFMPDNAMRPVDPTYAQGINSLSDGYPYLILSQASLDDLNARVAHSSSPSAGERIPMDRFRPNIVITGGSAHQEDGWKDISIGSARFALVKPCARCMIPTIDQRTGERGKEPSRTLATYRAYDNKVLFGMNAMATKGDVVRVGDLVADPLHEEIT
ncbi:MAG: MOSC N-terminal beta barrel domain-containing protein [Flavobacteriales bacterium]